MNLKNIVLPECDHFVVPACFSHSSALLCARRTAATLGRPISYCGKISDWSTWKRSLFLSAFSALATLHPRFSSQNLRARITPAHLWPPIHYAHAASQGRIADHFRTQKAPPEPSDLQSPIAISATHQRPSPWLGQAVPPLHPPLRGHRPSL